MGWRPFGTVVRMRSTMSIAPTLQQVDRTYVRLGNRKLIYFAGCDYFRLASHPQVLKAAETGLRRFGLNVAASRLTTGNHQLYETLEKKLAGFFGAETATLASNGYAPNLMVAQALSGQFSHALIDERAHGCLVDAAQLLDCPVIKFKHRSPNDVSRILYRLGSVKPLLLTDGMFSHDGSIAPLKEYLRALRGKGTILLDDAHGAGVLGKNGRGTPEHTGVPVRRIIQTITLSKAFGVYGGAVLGSRELRAAIVARSRLLVGNTPLPLPLANAAIKSVGILKSDKRLRRRLLENTSYVKDKLAGAGIAVPDSPAPIIPVILNNASDIARLRKRLLAAGIYPSFINYPGGPAGGYFRFVISSEHSKAQLEKLVRALANGAKSAGK
jgi:7-keto-8-aminopelargonate synthetase-like enzyme